jgi:hypothetical protein
MPVAGNAAGIIKNCNFQQIELVASVLKIPVEALPIL